MPSTAGDRSNPKASAETLFKAVATGDREAIRDSLYAGDDAQSHLAEAMADLIVNGKRLGDAARAQFGKDAEPIGRGMVDLGNVTLLQNAIVKQTTPDAATLEVPGQHRPMSFRRADGQWKLVITDFGGASPANIERQTRLVRGMAAAMDESAREFSAGKYKTPDAAWSAIQKRLHEVMLNFNRPATTRSSAAGAGAPTTSPADRDHIEGRR